MHACGAHPHGNILTCTVDSISNIARVTGTVETSFCVSALCILMTVVQVITLTFVNVYTVEYKWLLKVSAQPSRDLHVSSHY